MPVVHVHETDDRPGGAANVAVNLASLGIATRLVGVVGQDEAAESLQSSLAGLGIDCDFHTVGDRPTTTKTRVQSRGQQLIRLDQEDTSPMASEGLVDVFKGVVEGAGVVVLSDYGKGALGDVASMISLCRDAGVPVLVDPKGSDFAKYRGAYCLTPNQGEFEAVVGVCDSDDELVSRGQAMLAELDLDALLVTRSEKGMF